MDNRNLPPCPAEGALGAVSCQFGANASGDVVVTLNDSVSITTEGATAERTQEIGAPPQGLEIAATQIISQDAKNVFPKHPRKIPLPHPRLNLETGLLPRGCGSQAAHRPQAPHRDGRHRSSMRTHGCRSFR